jgi:hypothetical protein
MILEVNWPLLQQLGWRQSADGSAEAPAGEACPPAGYHRAHRLGGPPHNNA